MTTHVMFAIDGSGSMFRLTDDVIGGFNAYLDRLKQDTEIEYSVSVGIFNTEVRMHAEAFPILNVKSLDRDSYYARGNTALYDCVGKLIDVTMDRVKPDDRALMIVQTDGQENSSTEYRHSDIKARITELEATGRWSFVYLTSDPAGWYGDAAKMGFSKASTVPMSTRTLSREQTYSTLADASMRYSRGASGQSVAADVDESQQD